MTIKELLAKVAKGEALTDEEKAELAGYDPDKASNGAAAAARKAAEKERDALKAQLSELEAKLGDAENAGKSEVDQLKAQVAKLSKAVETATAAAAKAEGDRKALLRGTKLDRIVGGLKFVDGLDANLPRLALEKALADLKDEDLDNEEAVKPILSGFAERNKAILLDQSGGGAGTPAKDRAGGGGGGSSDPSKMTADQRAADLKNRGII
jgi:hypothetical protein